MDTSRDEMCSQPANEPVEPERTLARGVEAVSGEASEQVVTKSHHPEAASLIIDVEGVWLQLDLFFERLD